MVENNITIAEAIKKMISEREIEIVAKPALFCAILDDTVPYLVKERKILHRSLTSNVADQILEAYNSEDADRNRILSKLEIYLSSEMGLSEEWSHIMMSTFSEAFGWNYNLEFDIEKIMAKANNLYDEQNYIEAFNSFKKAGELGNPLAQCILGDCYSGAMEGVSKNLKLAVEWYEKAARQGFPEGQYRLGVRFAKGEGVERNIERAAYWHRKAAEQGHARAQLYYGVYLQNFTGKENVQEAFRWIKCAAEQGLAQAQYQIGTYYERGFGTNRDERMAKYWYQKAAEQGYERAKKALS